MGMFYKDLTKIRFIIRQGRTVTASGWHFVIPHIVIGDMDHAYKCVT